MPNSIQLRENSRGSDSDMGGTSHISDRDGNPNVFNVKRGGDGALRLDNNWANPDNEWNLDNALVFRPRNSLHFPALSCARESAGFFRN